MLFSMLKCEDEKEPDLIQVYVKYKIKIFLLTIFKKETKNCMKKVDIHIPRILNQEKLKLE